MFLLPRCRGRHNTYRNTYFGTPVFGQLSQWCGWKEYCENALESVTLQQYHFVTALKRGPLGTASPQYRGSAVLRVLARPFDLFRKMKSELTTNKYLYSVSDTAQLLSVSRVTVYALMKSGQILAVYPTSQARISAEAIKRYIAKLEKEQRDRTAQLNEVLR